MHGKTDAHLAFLIVYSWAEERKGALVVDVGGGAGGATLPVMRKYSHLHLQVQDRPETKKSFEEVSKFKLHQLSPIFGSVC
jgi:tRNA1(Val) A37 N6-methylase TrmN6